VKRIPAWLSYLLLRLVFLIVPFVVCVLLGIPIWLSIIYAVVIAFSLSTLLLYKLKQQVVVAMQNARKPKKVSTDSDEAIEDAL